MFEISLTRADGKVRHSNNCVTKRRKKNQYFALKELESFCLDVKQDANAR